MAITVHKEMPDVSLTKEEFKKRYWQRFSDPAFGTLASEIDRLADVAWQAYDEGRKSPYTSPAGPGFADPAYQTLRRVAPGQPKDPGGGTAAEGCVRSFTHPSHQWQWPQ